MNELDILKRNAGVNEEAPNMIKVRVINSGYRTDMGMKDAEIISQELDQRMMPILKVKIEDVLMVVDEGKPTFGSPNIEGATVTVKILENKKDKKKREFFLFFKRKTKDKRN